MGRKSRTHHLAGQLSGQHLALSVAAHLARTQLVPEPLYVFDSLGGEPREIGLAELEGAVVQRGATRSRS
jgi:hypothetical protein